jgi:RNA polymerase sigma factor (sigma-70 family)
MPTTETTLLPLADDTAAQPVVAIDLDALFRTHQVHLYRFVRRYVRNNEDAEDVVQQTFVEAVRCAPRYAGLSKPSTWLFGIALNLARNHVRRSYADPTDELDETLLEQIGDEYANPARLVELRQIAQLAQDMMENLSEDMRATFEAVLEGDCTYEDAATRLGIPIGTVRSRVSRVRAAIRTRLG